MNNTNMESIQDIVHPAEFRMNWVGGREWAEHTVAFGLRA